MTTHITIPVTGIDDITWPAGITLTPASATIRYDRRRQPHVTVTGPTREPGSTQTAVRTWDFGSCTCHTWLAELVEHHRPAGHRRWEHSEPDVWRTTVGRWINIPDTPDPHRDWPGAVKAALADAGHCEVLRAALTAALTAP